MIAGDAPQAVSFSARDGRTLAGLLLVAAAPRGVLVVNNATGYLREFYLRFAAYCAQRGYHALIYDYRGMGASAGAPPAQERARMSDWGRLDMPAALGWLAGRYPELPAFTLGHSVGGQLIGAMPNADTARAHVMIAASTGYWRRQRLPFRFVALAFWKLYGPWMLARRGFVPRGVLWRGGALPPGVFLQWRRWCLEAASFGPQLDPEFADSRFAQVRGPLLVWGFTDDPIATPAAVEALLGAYRGARIERRWTRPADVGARHLAHHGFFAERHRTTLWSGALDWLDGQGALKQ
jgi:predicted alpha/beta hydrolase